MSNVIDAWSGQPIQDLGEWTPDSGPNAEVADAATPVDASVGMNRRPSSGLSQASRHPSDTGAVRSGKPTRQSYDDTATPSPGGSA